MTSRPPGHPVEESDRTAIAEETNGRSRAAVTSGPLTPGGLLVDRPALLAATVLGLVTLVVVVAVELDVVTRFDDRVATGAFEGRTPLLDDLFGTVTELGGGFVIVPLAVLCASVIVAATRRVPAAVAVLLVVAARYGIEDAVKDAVGRARPPGEPVVPASGFSFVSGHVLGATVGWGIVPATVRAMTSSRLWWRLAVALWAVIVLAVAASRVYLGVHWLTDTVGSVLVGVLLLTGFDIVVRPYGRARADDP